MLNGNAVEKKSRLKPTTPPIAEILCVKNGRAIVVCGFLMKWLKKIYTESLKKIVGAVWELPAK